MNPQFQAVIFFIPIIISIFATLFYVLSGINKNQKVMSLFLQISGMNLIIFLLGGFFWFGSASDGIAQFTGWLIYAGVFMLVEIIVSITLYVQKRKIK